VHCSTLARRWCARGWPDSTPPRSAAVGAPPHAFVVHVGLRVL
jgi:hypothetical protein